MASIVIHWLLAERCEYARGCALHEKAEKVVATLETLEKYGTSIRYTVVMN